MPGKKVINTQYAQQMNFIRPPDEQPEQMDIFESEEVNNMKNSDKSKPQGATGGNKKKILQMPEGYYSGDKPNPNLRKFVEEHIKEKPYDPETDHYNVPAFDKPIMATKATAIYNMHTYWSKKPHDAIREYIRHYTEPGDLVLDPFCGSGGTALAALMEGRKAIAIDRSPAATFITKNYCTPVDVDELQKAFDELKKKVKPEIDWLYETRCDRCGGKAMTAYTVYSQVFRCGRCFNKVPLFDCVEEQGKAKNGKDKKISACPHCHKNGIIEEISTSSERFGAIPVLVSYICENCKPKREQRKYNDSDPKKREYFKKYDLGKLKEIEEKEIPYWYPTDRMMNVSESQEKWGYLWRRGIHEDVKYVSDFFTKRNLWTLASILKYIKILEIQEDLKFVFNSNVFSACKMQQYREAGGGFAKGTYYVPSIFIEREQIGCFSRKFDDILKAKKVLAEKIDSNKLLITTQSSINNLRCPSESIDYIFTDPPYADNIQYGELNYIWEAWLKFDTHWHEEEIIINDVRGKTEEDWANAMKQAMSECYRVLKPGRWISLCYHDTSEGTWSLIQDIMAEAGFIVEISDSALYIDAGQKSYNQLMADKVNKRDLVINFRKPRPGEITGEILITGDEDQQTFSGKVLFIIIDFLTDNPGSTIDHIFDEVVSKMVRRGEFERHNFLEFLEEIAEKSGVEDNGHTRWYLKETADDMDFTERAREDHSAEVIEKYMVDYLKKKPYETGVHYSDIFENYLPVGDKPRRLIQEWMWDYFYKTPEGKWRPPATDEEREEKAKLRQSGIYRKIKRFANALIKEVPIREKDRPGSGMEMADWVRECRRAGLYEHGRAIFEKGGMNIENLDEERRLELEEDYEICVRRQK